MIIVQVLLVARSSLSDCLWKQKGLTVGEGEAIGFKKKTGKVKICQDGKIKVKTEKLVKFTIACNGMYFLTCLNSLHWT